MSKFAGHGNELFEDIAGAISTLTELSGFISIVSGFKLDFMSSKLIALQPDMSSFVMFSPILARIILSEIMKLIPNGASREERGKFKNDSGRNVETHKGITLPPLVLAKDIFT